MMKDYDAPQIEWIRFDVYEIMESGGSGPPVLDNGETTELGEAEPW